VTLGHLIRRSLFFYWRTGLVVVFGLAVATAITTGALLIGDSVTGSLRDTALARLGRIDYALVAPHYFRAELADDLSESSALQGHLQRIVPLVITQGVLRNAASEETVPRVSVIGADEEFWQLYPGQLAPELTGRQAAVNTALAEDLHLTQGDFLLLTVSRESAAPSDTLFARRTLAETTRSLRLQVKAVFPDSAVGGFRLDAGTAVPRNLFLSREWLTTQLGQKHMANALLVELAPAARPLTADALTSALGTICSLEDYGLKLVAWPGQGYLSLQSQGVVLNESQVTVAREAAAECGARSGLTSVYLTTSMKNVTDPDRPTEIAYAVVAALDPPPEFRFISGGEKTIGRESVWLNQWAAQDLGAHVGDRMELSYLIPSRDGTYYTGTEQVTVRGIVEMTGPGADPGLVPDFEGITDAKHIGDWHPPFPLDLTRITPRDELYWDNYHAAPRAFLHPETVRAMWASGPSSKQADWVTAVRIMPAGGTDIARLAQEFTPALLRQLSAQETGLAFQPLRRQVLAASRGTTDFSQLMLGMSMFLVLAGAGMAGMLLRLSGDSRAAEAGIMMACGHRARTAVRVILGEGVVLTLLGVLIGVPLGVMYAWGIITALTTWWHGAVASTHLWLHVGPNSLLVGASVGLVVGLLAASWGARALGHRSVLELLSGWQSLSVGLVLPRRRWARFALTFCLLAAAGLVLLSAEAQLLSPSGAFFASGLLLLSAGLAAAGIVLTRVLTQRGASRSLGALALRSAAANRRRSLLTIGLLAGATFVIVAVAANTRDLSRVDVTRRDSGSGGFALQAVSSLPLNYDLGSPEGRAHLGFSPEQEALLAGTGIVSFLASSGQDISCLNLSAPTHPRVLGVSDAMIARGGFPVLTVQGKPTENPWLLLRESAADGAIPAFGDADTVRWSLHSSLGETYTMPDGSGRSVRLRFVGVIPGSIFASELLVAEDHFKRLFPGVDGPSYFLIETPSGKEAQVARVLRTTLGDRGLEVRSTREVLNSFLRVQNTYLTMFLALGGLGLLLGSVGLVAVLLRNALERRAEFALMLAIGFKRYYLARSLLLENAGLLLAGLLWGTLSALVAVAPQILSVASGVAWGALALVLAGIIIVGLAASSVAAPMAVRGNLIDALREE